MASKLRITSHSAGGVRHVGAAFRSVGSDAIAKALGADEVVPGENAQGAPISLHALRRELETRVRSTGGRPWKARRKFRRALGSLRIGRDWKSSLRSFLAGGSRPQPPQLTA